MVGFPAETPAPPPTPPNKPDPLESPIEHYKHPRHRHGTSPPHHKSNQPSTRHKQHSSGTKEDSGRMSQLARASLTAATLLLLLAAAAEAAGSIGAAAGSIGAAAGCQDDVVALNEACYQYVQKGAPTVAPSQECCDAVRGADVPCVCRYLGSPGVSDSISMEKVFYVTQQCGVSLPGNCGGGGSTHV